MRRVATSYRETATHTCHARKNELTSASQEFHKLVLAAYIAGGGRERHSHDGLLFGRQEANDFR